MTAEGRLSRMMPSGISGLTAPSSTVKLTVLMSLLQKDSVALIIETWAGGCLYARVFQFFIEGRKVEVGKVNFLCLFGKYRFDMPGDQQPGEVRHRAAEARGDA